MDAKSYFLARGKSPCKATPPLLRLFVVFCLWNSASFGGLKSVKGERILLLAKAKSSKSFCALRARFCVAESRVDFVLCV